MADQVAGRSAQSRAEAQRAKAQRLLASADRWERGAQGEAAAADKLRDLPPLFTVLHDLQVPGSAANIDHLVIGPSGVFVVDAKRYSQPLRVADGMVWRGRYSIRKELDTVTWEAAQAASVLGVPVHPVLCFVGSTLSDAVIDIGSVRATTDAHLIPAITSGIAGYTINDISRITLLAERHLPTAGSLTQRVQQTRPSPQIRKPAPRPNQRVARNNTGRTTSSQRRGRKKQPGSLVGALAMLAAAAVLLANPTTFTRFVTGLAVPTGASTTSDVALTLNGDFSCPAPGAGWTLTFQWPGDSLQTGYNVSTSVDQTSWTPLATWTSAAQAAPTVGAIATDTVVHVQLAAAAAGGANTVGTFRSPTTHC